MAPSLIAISRSDSSSLSLQLDVIRLGAGQIAVLGLAVKRAETTSFAVSKTLNIMYVCVIGCVNGVATLLSTCKCSLHLAARCQSYLLAAPPTAVIIELLNIPCL